MASMSVYDSGGGGVFYLEDHKKAKFMTLLVTT
jgi:hypothetical protein